jgi:hypothetical protein
VLAEVASAAAAQITAPVIALFTFPVTTGVSSCAFCASACAAASACALQPRPDPSR